MRRIEGTPFAALCAPGADAGTKSIRGADLGYRFDGADVDPEFQGRCANGGRRQIAGLEAFFEVLAKLLGQIAVMREELIRRSGLLGFQVGNVSATVSTIFREPPKKRVFLEPRRVA